MLYVIQRVDLDTCLTGAILAAREEDAVLHRPHGASPEQLADPSITCIEAGGSGQVELRNFDHHDTRQNLPPAATQAFEFAGKPALYLPLVEYNEMVDLNAPSPLRPPFPSVSSLISGIRFVHAQDPVRQFRIGVRALRRIAQLGLDPFDRLPWRAEWAPYLEEKARRLWELSQTPMAVELVRSGSRTIAFATTALCGAVGALYRQGADIAVVARPLDNAGTLKYTIASRGPRLDRLLDAFNRLEPGWGGPSHGTILGWPWQGSRLPFAVVRRIVLWGLAHTEERLAQPEEGGDKHAGRADAESDRSVVEEPEGQPCRDSAPSVVAGVSS
jgi:hypothetical protein